MELRDLHLYEPAMGLPRDCPSPFAATMQGGPREVAERIATALDLLPDDSSRQRLLACDRLVPLAPRAKRRQGRADNWMVVLLRGEQILLATSPMADDGRRLLFQYPEAYADLLLNCGLLLFPVPGLSVLCPTRLDEERNHLHLPAPSLLPFFPLGNGNWDLFAGRDGSIAIYNHETRRISPFAADLRHWFEVRYRECSCGELL